MAGSNEQASSKVTSLRHPGAGKKRTRASTKGRQLDPRAHEQVLELLGERPRRRDLLIEYLHLIQDNYHGIARGHLHALAEELRIPMAEAYEVATFYAHFDVLDAQDTPLPPITVRVCDSLTCEMNGAVHLLESLGKHAGTGFRILRAPCMGRCDLAPVVEVGHAHVDHASTTSVLSAVREGRTHALVPDYIDYEQYCARGGYQLLAAMRDGAHSVDSVMDALDEAGLRGLGGAGFPTGRKWRIVRAYDGPRLMAINGDEGEPGTFKDRFYLESDPHRFIEGALIAALAVDAQTLFIYLRDEYPAAREILLAEIAKVEVAGLSAHTQIDLRRGAGAYICGEESSMIESIEGKRGLPRHRPPYVAEVGIFGRPTLVHNIETVFWVRDIVQKGAQWFASQGRNGGKGMRSYSVSGRVNNPGVKWAPAGITVRELIDEFCGGMLEGHAFKAYLPGGASGGILPASLGDLPLEFGKLEHLGCFVGSHAVIVLSDKDSMKDAALNLMRFFEDESCGQCTPCRVGTEKAVRLMTDKQWNQPLLEELSRTMADASICGLGQAASNPLKCVMKHFPEDIS
jgi:NADH:ubiquinone oxidoreductase subunit F (NADH-binding)/NADH:ubiquinone oxidoreductase subunit E